MPLDWVAPALCSMLASGAVGEGKRRPQYSGLGVELRQDRVQLRRPPLPRLVAQEGQPLLVRGPLLAPDDAEGHVVDVRLARDLPGRPPVRWIVVVPVMVRPP